MPFFAAIFADLRRFEKANLRQSASSSFGSVLLELWSCHQNFFVAACAGALWKPGEKQRVIRYVIFYDKWNYVDCVMCAII
jgi:hypothetical protein